MTRPFVSFVFPVASDPEALGLLRRSVVAALGQTAPRDTFEVVVAIDGGHARDVVYAIGPVACGVEIVESQRTRGSEHLPHRNHARNAGCRVAAGEYLWVLDADMIPGPTAVEHLRALVERQRAAGGAPIVVTPCFAEPAMTAVAWSRVREPGVVEAKQSLTAIANGAPLPSRPLPLRKKTASGYHKRFRPGPPASARVPELIEGFPAVPRWLFDALGGFDERFVGYGGNKVSFVRALTLLDSQEQLLEVHLLTSSLFLHQPHARDELRFDEAHRAANWALFNEYVDDMKARAPWWRERVEKVRVAIEADRARADE